MASPLRRPELRMTQTLPLTWGDESILISSRPPIHGTSRWRSGNPQRIDPTQLEAAVHTACMAHPIARSRLVLAAAHDMFDYWEVVDDLVPMPIPVVDCPDDTTLSRLRTDFYSPPFPAHEAPQFRVQVARRPHGDLSKSMRLIPPSTASACAAAAVDQPTHTGDAQPPSPVSLEEARDLKRQLRPKSFSERAARALEGGRKLKDAAIPPARVAPDTTDNRTGPGFAHRTIEAEQFAELNARRPEGTTVNDMLIGAVGIAIEKWNRQHNDDANKIMSFMPVNLRPAEWSTDVVTNMFSYVSVSTMRRDRIDLASAAKAVAEQTAPIRRDVRALGAQDLLRLISPLPLGVKRRMPRLLRLTGNRSNSSIPSWCPSWAGRRS